MTNQDFNDETKKYLEDSRAKSVQDKIFEMDKTINLQDERLKRMQKELRFVYIITMIGFVCFLITAFIFLMANLSRCN